MGGENVINYNEFRDCVTKINKWYLKSSKLLTIRTTPYNSSLIYSSILNEIIMKKGNIIYIWGKEKFNYELINDMKAVNKNITYSYLEEGEKKVDITFVHFRNMINIRGYYDLCIIDDISSFSLNSREEIIELIEAMYLYSKRIILYSIEKVTPIGETLQLLPLTSCRPFVEPRILNTRVNLQKDIPYSLYDYLRWFKDNNRKVIIYSPSEEEVGNMNYYYSNIVKFDGVKIYKYIKGDSVTSIKSILRNKDRSIFVITNCLDCYLSEIVDKDIIVILSGEKSCPYKKMIYLCAEVWVGRKAGELILVSRDINYDMEKTKKISRDFNKVIWEKGLLK